MPTPRRPRPHALESLRNLGPVASQRLRDVGIGTAEELRRVGAVRAYRRLKERFPDDTTPVALYALQGALLDVPWNRLPPGTIERLREQAGETTVHRPRGVPRARHRRG